MEKRPYLTAAAACGLLLAAMPASAREGKLGFVITSWYTALYETKYMDECPEGLALGSDEIWFEGLSPADKDRLTKGGTLQPTDTARQSISYLRGRNGEDVCWNPEAIDPPPPMRVVESKFGFGMDLDKVAQGQSSPKSCAHDNFTNPITGETGIDNQYARIMGCLHGQRSAGYNEDHANRERRDEGQGNILIDVAGVDDPRNDPDVTVTFYLAETPLPHDSSGKIMPFSSYKTRAGRYGDTVKGKIVDGVLETQGGADVRLPNYGNDGAFDMLFRDFRLRLEIDPSGAQGKGIWAGYYDFDSFWDGLIKVQHNAHVGEYDCPSIYHAAKKHADGYPDPKTGQCTALSSAFRFEAVAAFIVPPKGAEAKTAAK